MVLLLVIIFLFPCVNAFSQFDDGVNYYFSSGISGTGGPDEFSNNWSAGPNFTLGLGNPTNDLIEILYSIHYNYFPYNGAWYQEDYYDVQGAKPGQGESADGLS